MCDDDDVPDFTINPDAKDEHLKFGTIDEKFDLVLEIAASLVKLEFYGDFQEYTPKVSISVSKDDQWHRTYVCLEFPDGKIEQASNWNGLGKNLNEAITSNLWSIRNELEGRIAAMSKLVEDTKKLAPTFER